MSPLEELISKLKNSLQRGDEYLDTVKHPEMLIAALEELHELIGNDKVKDAVADQITHLLMDRYRQSVSASSKEGEAMLNTALYGDPGVGKTLVGSKLAKIWYALGYLDGSNRKTKTATERSTKETLEDSDAMNNIALAAMIVFWLSLIAMILYVFFPYVWLLYTGLLLLGILIVILIYAWCQGGTTTTTSVVKFVRDEPTPTTNTAPDDLIVVVSRPDFVDKYLGWTDKKTVALLEANLGKVVFIDEAYSLVTGPDDRYGLEVINTINLFLSQHPKEIIVILAGYRNLLERNIFSEQPGLKRRFMWHFDCDGYTIDQCFQIFKFQVEKDGWKLQNEKSALEVFRAHRDSFPNYGGDTQRLLFFSKLEHDKHFVSHAVPEEINLLRTEHIQRGILRLRENRAETKVSPLSQALQALHQ